MLQKNVFYVDNDGSSPRSDNTMLTTATYVTHNLKRKLAQRIACQDASFMTRINAYRDEEERKDHEETKAPEKFSRAITPNNHGLEADSQMMIRSSPRRLKDKQESHILALKGNRLPMKRMESEDPSVGNTKQIKRVT